MERVTQETEHEGLKRQNEELDKVATISPNKHSREIADFIYLNHILPLPLE